MGGRARNSWGMARRHAPRRKKSAAPRGTLYIDEWIEGLQLVKQDVAKAAGISPSYLTNLNDPKRTPSIWVVIAIAKAMGLTVEELTSPPPNMNIIEAATAVRPSTMARLRQART